MWKIQPSRQRSGGTKKKGNEKVIYISVSSRRLFIEIFDLLTPCGVIMTMKPGAPLLLLNLLHLLLRRNCLLLLLLLRNSMHHSWRSMSDRHTGWESILRDSHSGVSSCRDTSSWMASHEWRPLSCVHVRRNQPPIRRRHNHSRMLLISIQLLLVHHSKLVSSGHIWRTRYHGRSSLLRPGRNWNGTLGHSGLSLHLLRRSRGHLPWANHCPKRRTRRWLSQTIGQHTS